LVKTKVFQFGKQKAKTTKPKAVKTAYETKLPAQVETPGIVQGRQAGSLPEWYVALALDKVGLGYSYQYDIEGGNQLRGGQILDFLVYTAPLPTPVMIQGEYWHGGTISATTQFNVEKINRYFKGKAQRCLEIWDYEALDREQALKTVKSKLL